jgi:tetratricopeptide (TPR) repeat protein
LIDGPLDEARELRAAVLAGGIGESEVKIAEDVESVLHARGWRAYQQGDFETARKSAERCLSVPLKRSAYALTLLGFSLLRLGDREGAERSIDEVLSLVPSFPSGRLFRAELAIRDGRYGEAETQALEVLKDRPSDETTIQWALNLFSQAWQMRGARECPPGPLGELAGSFEQSPNFLVYLAQEHYRAGRRPEAMKNVERALALAPDHGPAAKYRAEWSIAQHKKGSKEP